MAEIAHVTPGNSIPASERRGKYSSRLVQGREFISTKDVGFDGVICYETDVSIPAEFSGEFRLARAGATLVCAEGGSAGKKVGFLDRKVHHGNKLFAIASLGKADDRYLYWFCRSSAFVSQFTALRSGLIGGVSLGKFRTIRVPLPTIDEQSRIVAALDWAFHRLDRAQVMAGRKKRGVEELCQSTLSRAFNVGAQAPSSGESVKLGDVVTLNYGKALALDKRAPEGKVPLFGANGVLGWTDHRLSKGPSLVIGRKGSVGAITRVEGDFWPSDVTYFTSHDDSRIDFDYMHYSLSWLKLPRFARGIKPGLNRNEVYGLTIRLPALEEQRHIAATLREIFSRVRRLERSADSEVAYLSDLRRSMLRCAFAGELAS